MLLLPLLVPGALAQDSVSDGATPPLNVMTFRPSMDSHEFFRAVDTDLGEQGFAARGVVSYTVAPLQYTWWDGTTEDIVGNLVQVDAVGAYTIGDARIGVDLPLILRSFGGRDADVTGLGDIALDAKYRLLDNVDRPVGVALSGRMGLPTSTAGGALAADGLGLELVASVDKPIGDRVDAVLDVGLSFQPAVELENVRWGSTGNLQAGLAWRASERAGVVGELYTSGVLADLDNAAARPAELLAGGWYRTGPRSALAVRPAVAIGLGDAVTTPRMRALLGVAWDPLAPEAPADRDGDGLADAIDLCPDQSEDRDQYEDGDGCVELATLTVTVVDTDGVVLTGTEWTLPSTGRRGQVGQPVQIDGGDYQVEALGASAKVQVPGGGAAKVELKVPAARGSLVVEVTDAAGAPVPGATWSAVGPTPLDARAPGAEQVRPGTYQLEAHADGYHPAKAEVVVKRDGSATLRLELAVARAVLRQDRIEIKDSVYFETGKANLKPESLPLLEEVARILLDHPELTRMIIEGHTDARGATAGNQALSQARAESVRTWLIGQGVAGERLEAIGYGESRPLVAERTPADAAKNRRVDFVVAGRSDGEGPARRIETRGDTPRDR